MWYTMVTLNPMVLVGTMLGSWYLVNKLLSNNAMLFTTFWGCYFGTGWHKKLVGWRLRREPAIPRPAPAGKNTLGTHLRIRRLSD